MRPLYALAFAALLAVSCARHSPEQKLVKSIDAAASWVPALQMTAEKWVANAVPATFTASAAQAAQKEFANAQKQIERSNADRELRDRVAADFQKANSFAEALSKAVDHDNPREIVPKIPALPPINSDLDAVQKQYGGGS